LILNVAQYLFSGGLMLRQDLSALGLYKIISNEFKKILDPRQQRISTISIHDSIQSACAVFAFKSPSLLSFDVDIRQNSTRATNLCSLFDLEKVPSDTAMREIVDTVETSLLYPSFNKIFSAIQRGKNLDAFRFIDDHYLVALDGTGFFSSSTVHCENCCVKEHRDGTKTYYHQSLCGVLIHPDNKVVIPFAPEPITIQDGKAKNDCEREAAKRFLVRFSREHPHLKVIITEDGLASNAPHIELIKSLEMSFILGCKPGDHKHLFEFIEASVNLGAVNRVELKQGDIGYAFRYMNEVPLNDKSQMLVNFLECVETKEDGTQMVFTWVTDITINDNNVFEIMRGGRARWKIENETFNTLKNHGYNFEHNFGHGNQYLSNNFMVLMMLIFLIDQTQLLACKVFQKAREKALTWRRLWEKMRNLVDILDKATWKDILYACAFGFKCQTIINTS